MPLTTVQFVGGPWDGLVMLLPLGRFDVLAEGAELWTGRCAVPGLMPVTGLMPPCQNTRYRWDGKGHATHDPE